MGQAILTALGSQLLVVSETDLIDNVLASTSNGRILVHGSPAANLAQISAFNMRNLDADPSNPAVVKAYTVEKSGGRFKVLDPELPEGDDNIATLAGLSTITFSSFGEFVKIFMDGDYVVPAKNVMTLTDLFAGGQVNDDNVDVQDSEGGSLYNLSALTSGDALADVSGSIDAVFGAGNWELVGNDVVVITGSNYSGVDSVYSDNGNVGLTLSQLNADSILLDQINQQVLLLDTGNSTVDPSGEAGTVLASVTRPVESGAFFEHSG